MDPCTGFALHCLCLEYELLIFANYTLNRLKNQWFFEYKWIKNCEIILVKKGTRTFNLLPLLL